MRVFQITPAQSVLFGMAWRAYDAFESRHAQIIEWQGQGFAWSATYKTGNDTQVGLIPDIFDHPAKGKLFSAAALVALNKQVQGRNAIAFFISDNDVGIVGIINGFVVLDVCVPREDVPAQRNSFAQRCGDKPYVAVGPAELGFFEETLEWGDLIAGVKRSSLGKARIEKFKSDRSRWIAVGLTAAGLLGIAGYYVKAHLDEAEVIRRQDAAAYANDPIRKYEQSVARFLSNSQGVPLAAPNIKQLRQLVGSIQVNRAGWNLEKIVCVMGRPNCTGEWTLDSTKVGTFASFQEALPVLPADWKVQYGPNLSKLTATISLAAAMSPLPPKDRWPTFQDFSLSEASRWQEAHALGLNVELRAPEVQVLDVVLQPQFLENNPNAIHAARWLLTGRPWWLSEVFDKAPENVTLERIDIINNGSEITFNAEGKIYVRK
jgi:hypothetical protein